MTALLCPLCSQSRFNNLESLRASLIKAATQNLSCPICSEILMGLDKLTIHLFGHAVVDQNPGESIDLKLPNPNLESPEFVDPQFHGREESLEENLSVKERVKNPDFDPSTINPEEELSFLLSSWENSLGRSEESENRKIPEEGNQLSEYMSDLLNKKMAAFDFVAPSLNTPEEVTSEAGPDDGPIEDSAIWNDRFRNSATLSAHQELNHSYDPVDGGQNEGPPPSKSIGGSGQDVLGGSGQDVLGGSGQDVLGGFVMPRYDCHLCQKSFKMRGSLSVHYRVAHLELASSDTSSSMANQEETDEKNFPCSICNKSFKKIQHLTQHVKTHQGKRWKCETCNKQFTTKYFLKKHQRLHTGTHSDQEGEMPYSCPTCSKTFTFQQSYHKHLLYHTDEKPHLCTECGRSFKELSTLHNHQRIHSGEKPFSCESCGKCFRQRVSYVVHRRIHTGVLPYQCTTCNKKFRYKVSQRSHKCTSRPPGVVVVTQPSDPVQRMPDQKGYDLLSAQ